MNRRFQSKRFKSLFPYFLLAVAVIAAFRIINELEFFLGILRWLLETLAPFFYGFIIAYIVNIPIGALQRLFNKSSNRLIKKRSRMLSTIIVALVILLIIVLTINLIVPALVNSITIFIENFHVYIANITELVENFNDIQPFGWNISAEGIFGMLENFAGEITLDNIIAPINALVSAATAVFTGVIAFISSIYILAEKERIRSAGNKLLKVAVSKRTYEIVSEILNKLNNNFRQYIRTQTIDGVILGTLATIQLMIAGSPFALLLGLMLGIVNYVPYFGSIIGTVVAVVVVMFTQNFTTGIIIAGTLFITQQIDANVIQPRLMSGSFSLSPLFVIIGITVGGAIAGIIGMIVAIPIAAVLKDIYDSVIIYYERKKTSEPKRTEALPEGSFDMDGDGI